jgi:hypothetical protein
LISKFLPCSVLSLACLSSVSSLAAQGTVPIKAPEQVRLNRAPVSDAILAVHLPEPETRTLPNGLRILVLCDRSSPIVTLTLSVQGAGPLLEPENEAGVAGLTGPAMRAGTTSKTSQQLS